MAALALTTTVDWSEPYYGGLAPDTRRRVRSRESITEMAEPVSGPADAPARWASHANCSGIATYLFTSQSASVIREAKAVCCGCVVRSECLSFARDNGMVEGIWGGLTAHERNGDMAWRPSAPPAVHPSGSADGSSGTLCFAGRLVK